MNRADIIRMATAAGAVFDGGSWSLKADFDEDELMKFAALIAEDCAKRCDELSQYWADEGGDAGSCAAAIREAYKP